MIFVLLIQQGILERIHNTGGLVTAARASGPKETQTVGRYSFVPKVRRLLHQHKKWEQNKNGGWAPKEFRYREPLQEDQRGHG